jgi:2-aminoethylphosphonate-pyruvate transaminase
VNVPYLLTPGPLTTSPSVKEAMLRDWGSRDSRFIAMSQELRVTLATLAHAQDTHVCVPLQGSGSFVVEAMIATMVPRDGTLLVLVNGAYGTRMVEMGRTMGRAVQVLEWPEDQTVDLDALDQRLAQDQEITHVAVVHCETTSGIMNPVKAVADLVAWHERSLLIDAMTAFGALELDARTTPFDAVAASSNKCLEGVPGLGFALIRRDALEGAAGNSSSVSLDLLSQWQGFERNGQWRFTPPTHVVAAFVQALHEHAQEGGVAGRGSRYARNHEVLVEGMEALGFECLLERAVQAPIIVTFLMPADPRFVFAEFYDRLRDKGFLIYPGKLTVADSFRIGCIGRIGEVEIRLALDAVAEVLDDMGVEDRTPAPRV